MNSDRAIFYGSGASFGDFGGDERADYITWGSRTPCQRVENLKREELDAPQLTRFLFRSKFIRITELSKMLNETLKVYLIFRMQLKRDFRTSYQKLLLRISMGTIPMTSSRQMRRCN